VDFDDHRCVFGPATFAGKESRYFVANHGDTLPRLWVSDLETNRHWPVGETAVQLVRLQDGTVWGTQGQLHQGDLEFAPTRSWIPAWSARSGKLFRYRPGERQVESIPHLSSIGPIAEAPERPGSLLMGLQQRLVVFDPKEQMLVAEGQLPSAPAAVVTDMARGVAYLILADGSLWSCRVGKVQQVTTKRLAGSFGPADRGLFLLPRSRRLIALAADGTVSVFDPGKGTMTKVRGPVPPPAGPAVHPVEDVWYFADRQVVQYALSETR
jgi:hypothetical protein